MRKLFTTLFVCLTFFTMSKAEVIFDPATYAGTLKTGMAKDTIDGTVYLRVVLDGWNSSINVPAYTITDKGLACKVKFSKSAADTITILSNISAVVQLMDTVNRVDNPWGEGTIPSSIGLTQCPPSIGSFSRVTGSFSDDMKIVHQIQFFAQEKYGWNPLTGDTMWISAISTIDPTILFDPATFEGTLPAGMEIVDEAGTKLLKVTVNEWSSTLDIPAFNMGNYNYWTYQAKLDPGTTGKTVDQLNTFVQAMVDGAGSFSINAASSATLLTYQGDAKADVVVTQLQFASQVNSGGWEAQVGAIIYVGKITVSYVKPAPAPARNTYSVPKVPDDAFIDADGSVLPDEFWANVTAADVNRQALPVDETPKITDSYGTMKLAYDDYYLYVLIDVYDVTPTLNDGTGTDFKAWENDAIEVFVDMLSRRYVGQKRIDGEQHQLRFGLGRTDADTSAIMYSGVKEKATWGQLTGGNGWKLELQLPWPNLCQGIVADSMIDKFVSDSVMAGKKIGWEISIVDAKVKDTRSSIMNWANDQKADKAYNTNEFWGEITLGGSNSIKTKISQTIHIYPNPATNVLFVRNPGLNSSYEIINIAGVCVSGGLLINNQVNIASLPQGIYLMKVKGSDNHVYINRFIKE